MKEMEIQFHPELYNTKENAPPPRTIYIPTYTLSLVQSELPHPYTHTHTHTHTHPYMSRSLIFQSRPSL